MEPSDSTTTLPNEELSPLEQDVLDEYERLAENMKKVRHIPSIPSSHILTSSPPGL